MKLKASGATIAIYKYDAAGRRVEKDVGGTITRYVLDGVTVIEEYDGSDAWQASYIHGDRIDHPCAMDRADIADVDGDANTAEVMRFHYAQNALGSVSEITDPTGAVVEWVTYTTFGAATVRDQNGAITTASAVGNPFLYTGREWDAESGTYFYRARTYDPTAGRFLQRDPLGYVDGRSLYEYAVSSPTTYRDPNGTSSKKDYKFVIHISKQEDKLGHVYAEVVSPDGHQLDAAGLYGTGPMLNIWGTQRGVIHGSENRDNAHYSTTLTANITKKQAHSAMAWVQDQRAADQARQDLKDLLKKIADRSAKVTGACGATEDELKKIKELEAAAEEAPTFNMVFYNCCTFLRDMARVAGLSLSGVTPVGMASGNFVKNVGGNVMDNMDTEHMGGGPWTLAEGSDWTKTGYTPVAPPPKPRPKPSWAK